MMLTDHKKFIITALFLCLLFTLSVAQSFQNQPKTTKDDLISNLPIIIIETEQEIPDEPKIDGFMKVIDNGPGEINHENDSANNYYGHIGIEIRGQSSQMFPKKSYTIETRDSLGNNRNVPLLGMPDENDWVLYAPYSDKSMLRNYISFYIGRQLRNYATRTRFCEVIVNGDYRGVYLLMEKIKKDEKRVNIADLNPQDVSGEELTGGYIIKVDKIDWDFNFGTDGWMSFPDPPYPNAMNIVFQYYHPKADELHAQQQNYIRQYITEFENNLVSSDFSNPNTGYQKYINTTSFVDQMLLNEISKEVDKYRFSTYFYKEKSTDGGKLFAGPPWDFNLAYSNVDYWSEGNDYTGWLYELVEPHDMSIMFWWKRLMESNYFKNLAFTRWQYLRDNELSDEILMYQIDSVTNLLENAQERNYDRWPILGQYVWPNYNWYGNDYQDEVEFFENWLFNRLEWIDENIEGDLLNPQAHLSGFYPFVHIDLSQDYFSRPALKPKFFSLQGDTASLQIDSVIYRSASSISLKLSGIKKEASDITVLIEKKVLNTYQDLETNILALGIDDLTNENQPRIFASNSKINVYCEYQQFLGNELHIYNSLGQLVSSHTLASSSPNIIETDLPNGVYIIHISCKDKLYTQKLFLNSK
jgi:hypothetical protein